MSDEHLLSIDDIAGMLGQKRRYVADRLVSRPGFPPPKYAPTSHSRRWSSHDIADWRNGNFRAPPQLQEFPFAEVICYGILATVEFEDSIIAAAARAFAQAKKRAVARCMDWDLEPCDMEGFLRRQGFRCAVSKTPFNLELVGDNKTRPFAPSVDRIDSRRGYSLDNVRLVCMSVNFLMNAWGDGVFARVAGNR